MLIPFALISVFAAFAAGPASQSQNNNDWMEASLTLRKFPRQPTPDLSPEAVAIGCLRNLQFVDYPTEGAGLQRIYPFLTWTCVKHIVGENNEQGNLGGVERFCQLGALSPVLQPLFGATKIKLDSPQNMTVMPGTPTRGTVVSMTVKVTTAEVMKFQHKSGAIRDGISQNPPQVDMIIRLIQERLPPLAGCWLVRDIIDARYAGGGIGWGRHEGV